MKVALGVHIQDGPWGGGNRFAIGLRDALAAAGHESTTDLWDPAVDIALLMDPRGYVPSVSFGAAALGRRLAIDNGNLIVVHRINECDERKRGHRINTKLRRANALADHTVFIASWLKDLAVWHPGRPHSVILNGADPAIFDRRLSRDWDGVGPLRLVTHHWGGDRNKGFDCYEAIDRLLDTPAGRAAFEFTYVGRLPPGMQLRNATIVEPLSGPALGAEIARHHVYITASINEPAGMHHVEGAMCGLPLIYRRSGALPEYCSDFGLSFDSPADIVLKLDAIRNSYFELRQEMPKYSNTTEKMTKQYITLFESLIERHRAAAPRRRAKRVDCLLAQAERL